MIAHLAGTVFFRGSRFFILDVGGVGYKVFASLETLSTIPPKGEACDVFTYLHVRETSLDLFGFSSIAELEFFEMLIGISGIGPKSALSVLSVAPVDQLKRAIASGDTHYLTKVSGIGKKIAEKIIVELREKLSGGAHVEIGEDGYAIDALTSLGYTSREARDALQRVPRDIITLDGKLKEALKILGGSRA